MAEPKVDDDTIKRELKKSSKKSSKKSAAPPGDGPSLEVPAGASVPKTPPATSTPQKPPTASVPKTPPASVPPSTPPSMNDVPKMNFNAAKLGTASEPKASEGASDDKLKKKASKKKSPEASAPLPTGTENAAPSVGALSPSNAAVAKDEEEERARQAARREAKRQKQKEAEEAKRRKEELERQALELARREEEAKQRELRKAGELAALNANAEECQEEEDYDEDFENYDDDPFEEEPAQAKKFTKQTPSNQAVEAPDAETVQKIREALQAESKTPSKKPMPSQASAKQSKEVKEAKGGGAKKTNVSASIAGLKQAIDPRAKRVKEILEKKKMEAERFDMFQQMPLTDMDKYMSKLRLSSIRQVFVQTNDDARGVSTQTKSRPSKDYAMNFPDDMGNDSNGESTSSRRFVRFLESASHVCEVLIEENLMQNESQRQENDDDDSHSRDVVKEFSAKDLTLAQQSLLSDRQVIDATFSSEVSHWLVCAYSPSEENNSVLAEKSLLNVWDINQTNEPVRWLRSEGVVSCCAMGPTREMIVLCGTDEGAVQIWDLRLPPSPHFEVCLSDGSKQRIAPPTYSTAGFKYDAAGHSSPIASIHPILSHKKGVTFQFGSLDNRGILIVWSVVELRAEHEALVADTCVEIGGRLKLVKTAVLQTPTSHFTKPLLVGPCAQDFAFFPDDSNQCIISLSSGAIARASRFDKKLAVRVYQRNAGPCAATSLDFHPFLPQYFLAGYADGGVSLFHINLACEIASWYDNSISVSRVQWSRSRPGIFYIMYTNGTLSIWNLLTSRMSPILTENVLAGRKRKGKALMTLSADISRTCRPTIAIAGGTVPNQVSLHELSGPLAYKSKRDVSAVHSLFAGIV